MKNQAKLKQMGLDKKVRYYYLRFGVGATNVPDGYLGVATVCLIPVPACDGNTIVRGIAFCNPLDQFVRKLGRNIALGRAIKALEEGDSSEAIPDNTPAEILKHNQGMSFLSEFNPELTELEKKLMGTYIETPEENEVAR